MNLDAVQADAAGVLAQAENAYVKGDEAQAGMLEDRAMQRLRDAYRTHWNLPGTREVLSRGGRVMVPGDADLGRTLLRNSTEGYVRRTLRRMTQRVYREYQRQLWEPLLPTAVTFTVLMRALSEQPDRRKQARDVLAVYDEAGRLARRLEYPLVNENTFKHALRACDLLG